MKYNSIGITAFFSRRSEKRISFCIQEYHRSISTFHNRQTVNYFDQKYCNGKKWTKVEKKRTIHPNQYHCLYKTLNIKMLCIFWCWIRFLNEIHIKYQFHAIHSNALFSELMASMWFHCRILNVALNIYFMHAVGYFAIE